MDSSRVAVWGDERQPVVGAKAPSHRSIPLTSDLHVYPAHHMYSLHRSLSNVTGWKDGKKEREKYCQVEL